MFDFSNLTPTQISILVGIAASLLQVAFIKGIILKLKDWSDHHQEVINVVSSIVLPALITIGAMLASNTTFTGLFPHYAEAYLAAQAFYYTAIRLTKMIYRWYTVAASVKIISAEQTI